MSSVFICGIGAVSPAGWGAAALCDAVQKGVPLPEGPLPRPGSNTRLAIRTVPECKPRPTLFAHPRLRRASPVSQYAGAAALADELTHALVTTGAE